MIIRHADVFCPDGKFHRRDLVIRNGLFAEITERAEGEPGEKTLDAEGCYAIPGLIDIHMHGAMGYDVSDGTREAYEAIAAYELQNGITAICPATLTLSQQALEEILRTGAAFSRETREDTRYADLIGFNMEGPFISHSKKGAQNPRFIRHCDVQEAERFLEASGHLVKLIGLAPEENPDFEDFIRTMRGKVRISLAHSNAEYAVARRALEIGASHGVHLFNAMSGLNHREPGIVGALSDDGKANCEIICDGIHVHPAAVRAAFRMMGGERMVLISDSLRSTGMPDGFYTLGGQEIEKKGMQCRLVSDGNLAGSVTNLADMMRHAVISMHIPLEEAVMSATARAAAAIGEEKRYGSIEAGKIGDVVLLREEERLPLEAVIKSGGGSSRVVSQSRREV